MEREFENNNNHNDQHENEQQQAAQQRNQENEIVLQRVEIHGIITLNDKQKPVDAISDSILVSHV